MQKSHYSILPRDILFILLGLAICYTSLRRTIETEDVRVSKSYTISVGNPIKVSTGIILRLAHRI